MPEASTALRESIQVALQGFTTQTLHHSALALLATLGYRSDKTTDLGTSAEEMLSNIEQFRPELGIIDRNKVHAPCWKSCALLFQLTNDEIPSLAMGQAPFGADDALAQSQIESFVFLAIDLSGEEWSRTKLATITRELNKRFPMPAIVLFRQESLFSLAVIDRRLHLRDASRDVIDSRITVIKDVRLAHPHRAHIDILSNLALSNLGEKARPSNFTELYKEWIDTLSTKELNKVFYRQLSWWYQWAVKEVDFPKGGGTDRNAIGVIRLLTRLIFVWFIKERGLVPDALFERAKLNGLLKQAPDAAPDESNFYHAILQNLFFATLNQEMGSERRWAESGNGIKSDYLISLVYRYREAFNDPDTVLQKYFADVPYLNGGLFECLDEQLSDDDLVRRQELKALAVREGDSHVLRIDGFSRRPEAQAKVPNKLFFGGTDDAALNIEFDTKGKRYPVKGLIDLLESYKFTVDENTPLDEEVALDPELLGKVFENLLASYNPDTRTTARKQSGSFYTPREVVDYMVDEALVSYFVRYLPDGERREADFRQLLSHADTDHSFSEAEADTLVLAIEQLKALDPACGSGAFPMGILAKLFVALKKLDPNNGRWRTQNLAPLEQRVAMAQRTPDPVLRDVEISDGEAALEKHKKDFADPAYADYTRKLYLIEKCIFGADIQPIAVQIAKLRFFIALIVSQPIDRAKPNWNITPLPNLETKIVAANTLFGVPRHGVQGSLLDDPAIKQKEAELCDANAAYFTARTRSTKKRRKEKVQKLHEELVALLARDGFVAPGDAKRMASWDPFDQNSRAEFFDVEWMFGMQRAKDNSEAVFDIVIGNPPYVRQEEIKYKPLLKEVYKYECYTGTADLFAYFYERSVKLLKPHGTLSFITSNKWYRVKYGENLRVFMSTHTRLKKIIDFGDEAVFTALAYPTIVVATRREKPLNPPPETDQVHVLNWVQGPGVEEFPEIFASKAFVVPQTELRKESWSLEPKGSRLLLSQIASSGMPLRKYLGTRVYRGITTGLNKAFEIDGATRARLIEECPAADEIIKPYLRGQDVVRWSGNPSSRWVIFARKGIDLAQYPAVRDYLEGFRNALEPKPGQWDESIDGKWHGRKAGNYNWYEIQDNIAYWEKFSSTKIVSTKVSKEPTFMLDTDAHFLGNTAYFIPLTVSPGFLLALLNSTTSAYYCRARFVGKQNGYYEVQPEGLESFPIPPATSHQKALLELAVNVVLDIGDNRFEQLINGLVFELFFPNDLHAANIRLFDACVTAGFDRLANLQSDELSQKAQELASTIFANDHPIYGMLFDLQALEVVRIIEGKE